MHNKGLTSCHCSLCRRCLTYAGGVTLSRLNGRLLGSYQHTTMLPYALGHASSAVHSISRTGMMPAVQTGRVTGAGTTEWSRRICLTWGPSAVQPRAAASSLEGLINHRFAAAALLSVPSNLAAPSPPSRCSEYWMSLHV